MKKFICILFVIFIFLCSYGCSPKYKILAEGKVSQYYQNNKKSYDKYKIVFNHERDRDDLDYQLVYNSVVNVFKKNNYLIVENIYDADYAVFINFKVSSHTIPINHSVPITGQTGVNTRTTYTYGPYGVTSHTYTTPRYGTVGYHNYQTNETFFTHLLSVTAYDFSKEHLEINKKMWEIISVTSDENSSFREIMPSLLLVLENHMATDTQGNINIEIYEEYGKLIEKEVSSSDW